MARRRRVDPPSADDLKVLEAGFAAKPAVSPFGPPIAQVAAEAASELQPIPATDRAAAAKDAADATRLREAQAEGRLVIDIPVVEVVADELTRDRAVLDSDAMEELKSSITAHGLRLPIEVFRLKSDKPGEVYGLISGFRRLRAVRELEGQGATIRALIRRPKDVGEAYVSMVEENEIRADLSQYERGRVAVLATHHEAFPSVNAAVDALFAAGSKAKRSKVRSFALIHEELGDVLLFPESLSERAGLRLAGALRAGQGTNLREALVRDPGADPFEEWQVMLPLIEMAEETPRAPSRGGRPRSSNAATHRREIEATGHMDLGNGTVIHKEVDERGYAIRFSGRNVDAELVETVMSSISSLLRRD